MSMTAWRQLGRNLLDEWIEEDPQGQRRVLTPAGPLAEPALPDLRFGRLTASSDVALWSDALAHPTLYSSYGSLGAAYAVWSTKRGSSSPATLPVPAGVRQMVEQSLARRVWWSVVRNVGAPDLPSWAPALERFGPHGWPLGIDVGLVRRVPSVCALGWDDYARHQPSWRVTASAPPPTPPSGTWVRHGTQWWRIIHPDAPVGVYDLHDWAGAAPTAPDDDVWSSAYVPMSDPAHEPSGYVDPLLNQAQFRARASVAPEDITALLAARMGSDAAQVGGALSFDQQDAIWLALRQLDKKSAFLLADETGYGKGRVLAALARIGLNSGVQVLVVTEKAQLLSDFHRDCRAVWADASIPLPAIIQPEARVVDETGRLVVPTKNRRLPTSTDPWVWTTYSQFNRGKSDRLTSLLAWMGNRPTWVIMDESQNAAGASNTAQVISELQDASSGVVLSSATFAKNEQQLAAYRNLFQGTTQEWARLTAAFSEHPDTLRTAITLLWAEQGVFLRREHPPMALPQPIWVEQDVVMHQASQAFADWWRAMHECARLWSPHGADSLWSMIGEPLARATRELSILQKMPALITEVLACQKIGQKAVVVSDWTLSSHNTRWEGHPDALPNIPTWASSWQANILEMFPDLTGRMTPTLVQARQAAISALERVPSWSISPFDDLAAALAEKGVATDEISGRTSMWARSADGWRLVTRPVRARTHIVRDFNAGVTDALILTRAGNSGISLHAGVQFADQKQRHLIEWDVSPDASVRIQFWGRVRRKDQVAEPIRSTLLVDTPSERRRLNRDTTKHKKLIQHSGSSHPDDDAPTWISPAGAMIAREWAQENPDLSALVGGWYVAVDQLLARSVILPATAQAALLARLHRGVELMTSADPTHMALWDGPSRVVRQQWWWGAGSHALTWTERVWTARSGPRFDDVRAAMSDHTQMTSTAKEVVAQWQAMAARSTKPAQDQWLRWRHAAQTLERGQGVDVVDPETGARVRGVVLGWDAPASNDPQLWSATQIGVTIWLTSAPRPLRLSLAGWAAPGGADIRPHGRPAHPSWFTGGHVPMHALVLQGPPWSAAAWGVRHGPMGRLMHLHDEKGVWGWGWRMPSRWSWADMQATDRELAHVAHVLAFWRAHASGQVSWRWSPDDVLTSVPQPGGLVVSGHHDALQDKLPFKIVQATSRPKYLPGQAGWHWTVPWAFVPRLCHVFSGSGAIPTIAASHAKWHQATWTANRAK